MLLFVVSTRTEAETPFGEKIPKLQVQILATNQVQKGKSATFKVLVTQSGSVSCTGELAFVPGIIRTSGKTSFRLSLSTTRDESPLGASDLDFDASETFALKGYAVSQMGQIYDVPYPRVGHAIVTLGSRPPELYTVIERNPRSSKNAISHSLKEPGDLPDAWRGAPGTLTNALSMAIRACLEPDAAKRMEELHERIASDRFERLLAVETLSTDIYGYLASGKLQTVCLDPSLGKIEVFGGISPSAFALTRLPIMARGKGILASAYLDAPEGAERFLEQLAALANDRALEEALKRSVKERAALLIATAGDHIRSKRVEFLERTLLQGISKRYQSVREQSAAAKLSLSASSALPALRINSGKGNGSPLKNSIDYSLVYSNLLSQSSALTSSVPVRLFEAEISAAPGELESLKITSTNWVRVSFASGDERRTNVYLRLKGHGTRQSFAQKPSFTLQFKNSSPGEFNGSSKLHLQNSQFDPAFLNQFVGSWVYQKAQLPVAKIDFASIKVNGRPYGLFVVSEGITKSFLQREFGDGSGVLFEGENGDLNSRLDRDSGPATANWKRPMAVFQICEDATRTRNLDAVESEIDIVKFARFCAGETFLGHIDGYAARQKNYRFYCEKPSSPIVFLPHGMDSLAFDIDEGLFPHVRGIVATALFNAPEGRAQYIRQAASLTKSIDLRQLANDLAFVTRMIQPHLENYDHELAVRQIESAARLMGQIGDRHALISKDIELQQTFSPSISQK